MSTITEPQIGLIRTLFGEREIPSAVPFLDTIENAIESGTLSREFAQDYLIPGLKRFPYTKAHRAERFLDTQMPQRPAYVVRPGFSTADDAGEWADAHADEAPEGRHYGVYEGAEPGTFDVMCIPDSH